MNSLPYSVMTNVLDVIGASNEYTDCSLVRQKTLDAVYRIFSAERAMFLHSDRIAPAPRILIKNLDQQYSDYYQTYFHQFDPLQLLQGMHKGQDTNCLVEARSFSYDALQPSEYYNDFLKPQKVHHKLIINLVAEREIHGRIVLMRSHKSNRFTSEEIRLARTITPYLAHALANNVLRSKVKLKGNLLNYLEKQSSAGTILLDKQLRVVYINSKAEEIVRLLKSVGINTSDKDQTLFPLLKDCRAIKTRLNSHGNCHVGMQWKRTISAPKNKQFTICSKILDQEPGVKNAPFFMVCIEEDTPVTGVDPQYLTDTYRLTKREIEVATLLSTGLTNAQIGDKLFISEITVKKHLQSTFNKVGVNNRVSLINKMFSR